MKNKKGLLFLMALACTCISALAAGNIQLSPAVAEDTPTIEFSTDTYYKMSVAPNEMANTFEAWLHIDESYLEEAGVIIGNYGHESGINFEILAGGVPRMYYADGKGATYDCKFSAVDVRSSDYVHLAIVRNKEEGKLFCYLNGELKQTIVVDVPEITTRGFAVGGDCREGNTKYFRGDLRSVAIYSDVRSQAEIMSDMEAVDSRDEKLLAAYDLAPSADGERIDDLSQNGNDLKKAWRWKEEIAEPDDYAYSFAVVGDTQIITYYYPDYLANIYDYIVDNIKSKNIQHVFGLGDITDANTDAEWEVAKMEIRKLRGKVPYSLVRGNHDGSWGFTFNFGEDSPYSEEWVDKYNLPGQEDYTNTIHKFSAGNLDYMVVTLDYGASDSVLEWANEVIAAHPNHNVIISTHAYLHRDGTTIDQDDEVPPATTGGYNNGDDIWEKLVSKHKNIVLVLSGHIDCESVVMAQETGNNGNTVTQMLIDPQEIDRKEGGLGLVAMLYFSEDGKTVDVQWYSTVREQFFMSDSQFRFTIDTVAKAVTPDDSANDSAQEVEDSSTDSSGGNQWLGCGSLLSFASIAPLVSSLLVAVAAIERKKQNRGR